MALIIIGLVLVVLAVILFLIRRSQMRKLHAILRTATTTAQELAQLASSVQQELGGGSGFHQIAELKGIARCEAPLTSQLAGQPCIAYEATVTREYEETYYETDSQSGRREQKTRRSSDTVSSNKQRTRFVIEDATGRTSVDPDGAGLDLVQVVDRFEPAEVTGGRLSFGNFSLDLGGLTIGGGPGTRTLGYHFREKVLPLDRHIYVLGEASDSTGELVVGKPRDGKTFIVSLKSEEELVGSARSSVRWLLYASGASGAVGVVLFVLGLLRR